MAAALRQVGSRFSFAKMVSVPAKANAGCITPQLSRTFVSFRQAKSGLWVPEIPGEKPNLFQVMLEFVTESWHKLDESTRKALVNNCSKSVLATISGAALLALENSLGNLSEVKTTTCNVNKQDDSVVELIKTESKKNEEAMAKYNHHSEQKIKKVSMDVDSLKIVAEIWLLTLLAKSPDPSIVRTVNPDFLYDPVTILSQKKLKSEDQISSYKHRFDKNNMESDSKEEARAAPKLTDEDRSDGK